MKFSPVNTFKLIVLIFFTLIVIMCAFRNYPQSETLTIVRNTSESSAVQSSTVKSEQVIQTTQTKAVSSLYSEPEIITSNEEPSQSSVTQQQPKPPADTLTNEISDYTHPTELISVEKTSSVTDDTSSQILENSGLININTATAAQLKTLSGIGDVKAQAIIEYRELHGDFASIDEITLVNGIGEKTLEKIRDYITV